MVDFVTLTCQSCSAELKVNDNISQFACGQCGSEYIVQRGGGVVGITPVGKVIEKMQVGVDKTASELAIQRLTKEINYLTREMDKFEHPLLSGIGGFLAFIGVFGILLFVFDGGSSVPGRDVTNR